MVGGPPLLSTTLAVWINHEKVRTPHVTMSLQPQLAYVIPDETRREPMPPFLKVLSVWVWSRLRPHAKTRVPHFVALAQAA